MNATQKAQLKSLVSSTIALANAINETEHATSDPDLRALVEAEILAMLDLIQPDPTSWPFVKDKFFYDIYLLARADAGTLTEADETRSGLSQSNFSDLMEWHRHSVRVSQKKVNESVNKTKVCTVCGEEKSATKFQQRGGGVCGACRAKKARERRKEEA
jgi:hypothetical protein